MRGTITALALFIAPLVADAAAGAAVTIKLRAPRPRPITDLVAVTTDTYEFAVKLTWSASDYDGSAGTATSYQIACSTSVDIDDDADWQRSDVYVTPHSYCTPSNLPTPGPQGSFEVLIATGLRFHGTTYYLAVRAVNAIGRTGKWSKSAGVNENNMATASNLTPQAPGNVRMNQSVFNTAAHVLWDANEEFDILTYTLWRTTISLAGTPTSFKLLTNIDGSLHDYFDSGLTNGVTYYYRVTAKDVTDLVSAPSLSTGVWAHPPLPLQPKNLSYVNITTTSIRWAWLNTSLWHTGYRILLADGNEAITPDLSPATTQYQETGFSPGQFLPARLVEGFNVTGSSFSISISTWLPANPPSNITLSENKSKRRILTWGASSNDPTVRYQVQKHTGDGIWLTTASAVADTNFTDASTLAEGSTVFYRLRARSFIGNLSEFAPTISTAIPRISPAPVTEITAKPGKSEGQINLYWIAPGDDGNEEDLSFPSEFRLHWSSNPSAVFVYGDFQVALPTTTQVGALQSYTVNFLEPGNTYYFAIHTADEAGLVSRLTTVAQGWAQTDVTAPQMLTNFTPKLLGATSAYVQWLTPGDDGLSGFFNGSFKVGYSSSSFTSRDDFLTRATQLHVAATGFFGVKVSTIITDISTPKLACFAVVAFDDKENLSNLLSAPCLNLDNIAPADVTGLSVTADPLKDRVLHIAWSNPAYNETVLLTVAVSTSLAPSTLLMRNGIPTPMSKRTDKNGAIILSTMIATASTAVDIEISTLLKETLSLDNTFYVLIKAADSIYNYSPGVWAEAVAQDKLSPDTPASPLVTSLTGGSIVVSWLAPRSNDDGSAFTDAAAPKKYELDGYRVYASTMLSAGRALLMELPASATSFVTAPGAETVFYTISAVDAFGNDSPQSIIAASDGSLYAPSPDYLSYARLLPAASRMTRGGGNPLGKDMLLRGQRLYAIETGLVYNAMSFWLEDAHSGERVTSLSLPEASVHIVLNYGADGQGLITTAAADTSMPLVKQGPIDAKDATRNLALYWDNGVRKVKIYGAVDAVSQTVTTTTSEIGTYYLQKVLREMSFDLDVRTVTPRVITPDGDGYNDIAIFRFDNPKDSQINARIFSSDGSYVAQLAAGPGVDTLKWDGRDSGGSDAPAGVYVYQIEVEGKVYNGTLVIAR